MAKHDLTYSLMGTKRLNCLSTFLRNYNRDKQEKLLKMFIKELVTNKEEFFNNCNSYENQEFQSLVNRIKKSSLWKSLKACPKGCTYDNIQEQYPNLVGELFTEFYHKGWRQDAGQFFTPQQIADELECFGMGYSSIYDPCAGVGALLLGKNLVSDTGVRYAEDLPWMKFWYDLNALYHGVIFTPYDDSIVDLMLLNPPFNTKVFDDHGKEKDGVLHFLELASNKANELLLIVPVSFDETNRTYKKNYLYLEEHFNILARKNLDNDVFSWYETKISTMILHCKNKVQKETRKNKIPTGCKLPVGCKLQMPFEQVGTLF